MFKVGDRVRVKVTIGQVKAGTEGEIISTAYSFIWPYKVLCDDKQELICTEPEIELILPMPQTPSYNVGLTYAGWDAFLGPKSTPVKSYPLTKPLSCNHQWKRYIGFTHRYDFCTLCPAKRDIAS